MVKVLVTSDIHIGADNSRIRKGDGESLWYDLLEQFKTAKCVVLNGDFLDILDRAIRQALGGGATADEASLEKAQQLIADYIIPMMEYCPNTTFLYVAGNRETGDHNQVTGIAELFKKLAADYPQFYWYDDAVKIADHLVFHSHKYIAGAKGRSPEELCPVIYAKISSNGNLHSIKGIITGHTHLEYFAHEYEGILFYNTGAMIKGCTGTVLELDIDGDLHTGRVVNVNKIVLGRAQEADLALA